MAVLPSVSFPVAPQNDSADGFFSSSQCPVVIDSPAEGLTHPHAIGILI